MIDVTDEMVQLVYERIDFVNHGDDGIREGLAAVLAIVERDYRVEPRIQTRCSAAGPDDLTCQRSPDHGTNHAASNGDELVQW